MKKLVLIMVSALVLTIFISFNYLLWLRGEQVSDYQDKVNTMDQQRILKDNTAASNINEYMGKIIEKDKQIESFGKEIDDLKGNIGKLEQDKQQEISDNNLKDAVINKLKLLADLEPLKITIENWVDFINNAKYEDAYKLQNNLPMSQDSAKNLNEFSENYKKNIKSIKVKSISLLTEGIPDEKKGEIIFKVVLDVTKIENAKSDELIEGLNDMYFTLTVDDSRNVWVIANISTGLN